jgi:ubiquinone/menaquinone biosynthesis C-methylase UbiE
MATQRSDIRLSNNNLPPQIAPACVSVAEGYARWAATYDHAPNPLLNLEERKLAALLPDLRGKRVLDLGCGTGRWLERISMQGAGLGVGIDFSAAMLSVAAKKPKIAGQLAQADCLSLPFQSAAFDFVICSFALSHIQDMKAMVRELARVTRPGGDVFVTDLHSEAYARGWRTGFRDRNDSIQIEIVPRTAEGIVRAFYSGGLECLTHVPLCFGEPERPIFAQAEKSHLFAQACSVPAVLFCHFRLSPPSTKL